MVDEDGVLDGADVELLVGDRLGVGFVGSTDGPVVIVVGVGYIVLVPVVLGVRVDGVRVDGVRVEGGRVEGLFVGRVLGTVAIGEVVVGVNVGSTEYSSNPMFGIRV